MALDAELAVLFGREVLAQAKQVPLDALEVDAELVAEGARQLRQAGGQPVRQRAIVQAMDEETALALCKWCREPDMGYRLQAQAGLDFKNRPDL